MSNWRLHISLLVALVASSCSAEVQDGQVTFPPPAIAEDLIVYEDGKADSANFSPHNLIDDATFEDAAFMTTAEIQDFFERNPYGATSYLATYTELGDSAAEIIGEASLEYSINPLVLLTKLQVETSLVYSTGNPSEHTLKRAMGCGCHDGNPLCSQGVEGFRMQIRCAAQAFRSYFSDMESRGTTISGWSVGKNKYTQDDVLVLPANKSTAALYTYTPWVLPYEGGNWLFRNVYLKFSRHVLQTKPNHHWIGGACTSDSGCSYTDGLCQVEEGQDAGFCTADCSLYCPESSQTNTSGTFCVDLKGAFQGSCVAKCDLSLFPGNDGCAAGFQCLAAARFGDPNTSASVCLPE